MIVLASRPFNAPPEAALREAAAGGSPEVQARAARILRANASGGGGKSRGDLVDAATGEQRTVVGPVDTIHLGFASWSPDGRQVAAGWRTTTDREGEFNLTESAEVEAAPPFLEPLQWRTSRRIRPYTLP